MSDGSETGEPTREGRTFRCPRCEGLLIEDAESEELVCFSCSRRFKGDGSTTARAHEKPVRNNERIGGMRF